MKHLLTVPVLVLAALSADAADNARPNIILLLADDYGLPGVGCYGGIYKTPQLDSLAAGGVRFERCFAAPLCAPSRALLMSGRYAFRTGVRDNGSGGALTPQNTVSIAKLLQQTGYATAMAGKWSQLTLLSTPAEAEAWGFDEFLRWEKSLGERYWKPALNKNGEAVPVNRKSYGPDLLHEFVADFIRRHRDQPFFVYYPTPLVHGPILRTPDSPEAGGDRYADNVTYLDKLVGQLVAELDALRLREKTLIVFVGDNGSVGQNASHRISGQRVDGQKGTVLEGGSRVPLIVNWKGTTPAGRVLKDLVDLSDFYATFAELAGAKLPDGVTFDGRSFAPQLRGEKGTPRDWVYIQLGAEWYARSDRWKLTQARELFDMQDAPFAQRLVPADGQSAEATAAREQLQALLDQLDPSGGSSPKAKRKAAETKNTNKKKARKKAK